MNKKITILNDKEMNNNDDDDEFKRFIKWNVW